MVVAKEVADLVQDQGQQVPTGLLTLSAEYGE
jgi:hypothetical protein